MRLCAFYTEPALTVKGRIRSRPRARRLALITEDGLLPLRRDEEANAIASLHRLRDKPAKLRDLFKRRPLSDPDALELAAPMPVPRQFLDFYAFEEHVRTARSKRGLEVPPEWYEIPVYYLSNPTSFLGSGEPIRYPAGEEQRDFELELACVLGAPLRNASLEEAQAAIFGYTLLNDCSARQRQRQAMAVGLGPNPGKDFASVLGPVLVSSDELPDPGVLTLRALVNGEVWSEGSFSSIRYSFAEMLVYASRSRTLFPGDVLGSGTIGGGCGLELGRYLAPGDTVRLEASLIGAIENLVTEEVSA